MEDPIETYINHAPLEVSDILRPEESPGHLPNPPAIEHFAARLAGYKTSKGAIQIPYSQPLDEELIQVLVRFKLKEVIN
jgi:uncharacterized protein YdhG (YjbR/CyaY superfamily)